MQRLLLQGKAAALPNFQHMPLYLSRISAGFPSPADDFIETRLDLNQHLVAHPAATYFVRVTGHSMKDAGILDGDLLIVDTAITAKTGMVVIAVIDGELTVKRLHHTSGKLYLMPENPDYPPIEVKEGMETNIWGVVKYAIHRV
jgi:DNA polymerase V